MQLFLQIGIPAILLVLGFILGRRAEKRHFDSIVARENGATSDIVLIGTKTPPDHISRGELVIGSVVVASDYYKRFIASIVGLFGGSMSVYESLLERARREAILRMKTKAKQKGATTIINVKVETATLSHSHSPVNATIEVIAYGTAVK